MGDRMESVWKLLLDMVEEAAFVIDRTGVMIYANRAHGKLLQETLDVNVGHNMLEQKKRNKTNNLVVSKVLATKKPAMLRQLYINNEGRVFDVLNEQVPILDQDGKIEYIIGRFREVIPMTTQSGRFLLSFGYTKPLVFQSDQIRFLLEQLMRVAPYEVTVLLTGETGTGKDLMAEYIHQKSGRRGGPLIRVNCAAIPEQLMESELFGYSRGAFTGANKEGKRGMIEAANGGTLFLDEINSMPLVLQEKLLRTLENKTVRRLGSNEECMVDFRLIAASNEPLTRCIEEHRFRKDLYFRLNVISAEIPPLRERREDILPIADYYVHRANIRFRKSFVMPASMRRAFYEYQWPGNVRELRNAAEQAVLCGRFYGEIRPEEAELALSELGEAWHGGKLRDELAEVETGILQDAIQKTGPLSETARQLDITPETLSRKITKYGLRTRKGTGGKRRK